MIRIMVVLAALGSAASVAGAQGGMMPGSRAAPSPSSPANTPDARTIDLNSDGSAPQRVLDRLHGEMSSANPVSATLAFPSPVVFTALQVVYSEMDIPGNVVADSSMLASDGFSGRHSMSQYYDCGMTRANGGGSSSDVHLIAAIRTRVTAVDSAHTTLTTTTAGFADERGGSQAALDCRSTGLLERQIAKEVGKLLKKS